MLAEAETERAAARWEGGLVTGVTIVTPGYEALATEAVKRFRAATGCEVLVIQAEAGKGFETKLRLHELAPRGRVLFFDADWWALRKFDVEAIVPAGPGLGAVHDPAVFDPKSWPGQDVRTAPLEWGHYVNTGLLGFDLREPTTRHWLEDALAMWANRELLLWQSVDPTDQGWLNVALQASAVPVQLLPFRFNCYLRAVEWGYYPHIPRGIIGLHAAGVPLAHKLRVLRSEAAVFGQAYKRMQRAAITAHHQSIFDLK